MKSNEAEKAVFKELASFMESHGYVAKRTAAFFVKSGPTLDKRIAILPTRWSGSPGPHIDHYCYYRLLPHQDILNQYNPYINEKKKKFTHTMGRYFYNLVPQDFDWKDITVATEADVLPVVKKIEQLLTLYSFPYLDRFNTAEEIVEGFRGQRSTWAVEDPILRYQILLVDDVLKRDPEDFNMWYREAIDFCENRTDGEAVKLRNLAESLKSDHF